MRWLALLLACVAVVSGAAVGAVRPEVIPVARPAFPQPLERFTPAGMRLQLVSTTARAPTYTPAELEVFELPRRPPLTLKGEPLVRTFAQPGTRFFVYGTAVLTAFGPQGGMKYAFDLTSFGFPPTSIAPRAYGPQEIVWARQVGRLLVVQTSHLGYAKDSANRNGYLTGIDIDAGKVRWRSPSLVANAENFLVVNGLIVSGYGFTAERDWLYVLDAMTGRAATAWHSRRWPST